MFGYFNALLLLPQNICINLDDKNQLNTCFMRYFTYLFFFLTGHVSQIVFPLKEHFSTALSIMWCVLLKVFNNFVV